MSGDRFHVLPLDGGDKSTPEHVILRSSRQGSGHELDLNLTATENHDVFQGRLEAGKLARYRSSTYDGSEAEWEDILRHVFLSRTSISSSNISQHNILVSCSLEQKKSDDRLVIRVNSRVEDIVRKLGAVKLSRVPDASNFDLFTWMVSAVQQRDEVDIEVGKLTSEVNELKSQVAQLDTDLEEFIEAKKEHEDQMLAKFALLLNEKKLRIRMQQRQLLDLEHAGVPVARSKRKTMTDTSEHLDEQVSDLSDTMDLDRSPRDRDDVNDSDGDHDSRQSSRTAESSDVQDEATSESIEKSGMSAVLPVTAHEDVSSIGALRSAASASKAGEQVPPDSGHEDDTESEDDEL